MKVTGTTTLSAPPRKVWATILDPAVLARALPGCESLESTGANSYRGAITAGIASIKGTFLGDVELTDLDEPVSLVMRASGAGGPGTVNADVRVNLADLGDGRTELRYDADAVVGGMVGGVGQRMLTGVAKKMAGQFFSAIDAELTGTAPRGPRPSTPSAPERKEAQAPAAVGAVHSGRAPGQVADHDTFVRGALFGAAIAVVGVLVGAWAGRRGRA